MKRVTFCLIVALMQLTSAFSQDILADDTDGPAGQGDLPTGTDIPLDNYQWVLLMTAVGYGLIYVRKFHRSSNSLVLNEKPQS